MLVRKGISNTGAAKKKNRGDKAEGRQIVPKEKRAERSTR